MSIPALNTGLAGIQQGFANLRRDATAVSQAIAGESGGRSTEITTALVNLKFDKLQVQASTKVVDTVSELLGQLLDVKA